MQCCCSAPTGWGCSREFRHFGANPFNGVTFRQALGGVFEAEVHASSGGRGQQPCRRRRRQRTLRDGVPRRHNFDAHGGSVGKEERRGLRWACKLIIERF